MKVTDKTDGCADGDTVTGVASDITDRKRAEEDLRKANDGLEREVQERTRSEEDLKQTLSLLRSTLESTADGILVVDGTGKTTAVNKQFTEMWHIPGDIIESQSDDKALAFVLDQLNHPEEFLRKVRDLYSQPDAESFDVLEFKDGRVFERYSRPQRLGEEIVGRVWSFRDVTKRRHAEDALRESEEMLAAVLDALPDVVGVQLPDHTIVRYNRAGYELVGLPPEQVHGRKCYELIGRSEQCQPCATALALKSKKPESVEKYVPELGRHLWCTSTPLLDQNGEVRLVIERLLDITERKKAETALWESEAKYRFLAEHASDVLWTVDLNLRTTYTSPSVEQVLGFTPEERMQQSVESQLTPESLDMARQRLLEELNTEREQGARSDQSIVLELNYLHKNGSIVCLESVMTFIRDEKGIPIGVHGLSRDITERRNAEAALRESEEFNRNLVEHVPFGIIYLAGDGTVEYVNPGANRIAGLAEGQVSPFLGRNILALPGLSVRSEVRESLRMLLAGESLSGLEVPYKSSTGLDTVLLVAATPRFASDQAVAGAVLMFTDISERKRAEELSRETARYKAVADLAGGVAHNFNNLLQIVMGYLELALIDLELGNYDDIKAPLEQVLESSKFGAETIRRLQSFAGIRDHSQAPQRGVFDLSEIVKQALEMSKTWWKTIPEKQGKKVSLDVRLQDGCLVRCEKNELFEVVVNLIKNATEALTEGGAIDVDTKVEGDRVILKVRDTGVGLSEPNLKRLFNPFFTTKAAAGAGLGLASGRKIIEEWGGTILADSTEGKGTTFTVLLPFFQEEPKAPRTEKTDAIIPHLTVLAIDDESAILEMLKNVLTRYNCEVFTALSGEKGLNVFKETHVDLVICDLGMPGMNGWEVGKRIRAICHERGIKKTPFILLTGWGGQKTEVEKITACGVDVVLEKPLNIRNMLEAVRDVAEPVVSKNTDT